MRTIWTSWKSTGWDFRRFLLASTVSFMGDGIRYAALPLLAVRHGARAHELGYLLAAATLPFLLLGLFGGVLVDRLQRRSVLIACDVLRVAITLAFVAVAGSGRPHMTMLYAFAFVMGTLESVATSATFAYLPSLVDAKGLGRANGGVSTALLLGRQLLGPLVGAALIESAESAPFLVDSASFLVSGLLIASIALREGARESVPRGVRGVLADIGESARWMRRTTDVMLITCCGALVNLVNMGVLAIQPRYAEDVLHGSASVYGLMMTSAALGGVTGSPLAGRFLARISIPAAVTGALALIGLGYLDVGAAGRPLVAYTGLFVTGVGFALWNVSVTTWRQRITPDHLRGRADALSRFISWGVLPAGSVLGGVIAAVFGYRAPFMLAGVGPLVLCLVLWSLRVSRGRSLSDVPTGGEPASTV